MIASQSTDYCCGGSCVVFTTMWDKSLDVGFKCNNHGISLWKKGDYNMIIDSLLTNGSYTYTEVWNHFLEGKRTRIKTISINGNDITDRGYGCGSPVVFLQTTDIKAFLENLREQIVMIGLQM